VVLDLVLLSCVSWMVADILVIARFLLTPPPHNNYTIYLIIIGWSESLLIQSVFYMFVCYPVLPVFLCGIPLGTVGIISDSFTTDLGYPN